jgi:phage replication O-like protein O
MNKKVKESRAKLRKRVNGQPRFVYNELPKEYVAPKYFTQFPNSILDNITAYTPAEFKVLSFIVRKTCGFRKAHDRVSLSQISENTGISRKGVTDCLDSLVEKKALGVFKASPKGNRYWILNDDGSQAEFCTINMEESSSEEEVTHFTTTDKTVESGELITPLSPKVVNSVHTQNKEYKEIEEKRIPKNSEDKNYRKSPIGNRGKEYPPLVDLSDKRFELLEKYSKLLQKQKNFSRANFIDNVALDAKYTGNFKSCSLEYLENAIAISEKYLEFSQKDKSTSEKRKYNKKPKTNDVPIWSYANSDDFWAGKITLNRA